MKERRPDTHEFSFYYPAISGMYRALTVGALVHIDDKTLYHRIARVLRLETGALVTLFDQHIHLRAQLIAVSKRSIDLKLLAKKDNELLLPAITFFLPILKRDAFEQVIYSLVELGATAIQLMGTQKVQRTWGGTKELDRLRTIMIAAAEQSKQYVMPTLQEPNPFAECVHMIQDSKHTFFFDPAGDALLPIIVALHKEQPKHIYLMIGPEGDLTMQEKELLKERSIQFLRLTPTVLRAQQAVAVAMGICRSIFY